MGRLHRDQDGRDWDLLFILSSESHEHAQMLERIQKMIRVETGRHSPPLQRRQFNFANMKDNEIMNQLLKYDKPLSSSIAGSGTQ